MKYTGLIKKKKKNHNCCFKVAGPADDSGRCKPDGGRGGRRSWRGPGRPGEQVGGPRGAGGREGRLRGPQGDQQTQREDGQGEW